MSQTELQSRLIRCDLVKQLHQELLLLGNKKKNLPRRRHVLASIDSKAWRTPASKAELTLSCVPIRCVRWEREWEHQVAIVLRT